RRHLRLAVAARLDAGEVARAAVVAGDVAGERSHAAGGPAHDTDELRVAIEAISRRRDVVVANVFQVDRRGTGAVGRQVGGAHALVERGRYGVVAAAGGDQRKRDQQSA